MSKISNKEVRKLSLLARVAVNEKETKELQGDMEKILVFVSKLKKAHAISDVDARKTSDVGLSMNVVREDKALDENVTHKETLLRQAPEIKDGFVKVKRIFE